MGRPDHAATPLGSRTFSKGIALCRYDKLEAVVVHCRSDAKPFAGTPANFTLNVTLSKGFHGWISILTQSIKGRDLT